MKISDLQTGMFLQVPDEQGVDYYEVIEANKIRNGTRHFVLRNHDNYTVHLIGFTGDDLQYKVVVPLPDGVEGPNLPATGVRQG